ncbi:MAG: hypothetical protein LBK60_09730 [Verrucomicrobiales bacterium]|nr:hypothetical protein [Verrucomicrobiales bacterium]
MRYLIKCLAGAALCGGFFTMSVSGSAAADEPPLRVALFQRGPVPEQWSAAVSLSGATEVKADTLLADGNGILIVQPGGAIGKEDAETLREKFEEFLMRGGSIIFPISQTGQWWQQWGPLMPVSPWTANGNAGVRRADTGALAPDGSPFAAVLQTPGFLMGSRFDLHLPYSSLESGSQRYPDARLDKPLLNTDWRVLLESDQDGHLPLLVAGRYGPGRALVFAGDLFAPPLTQWAGYGDFIKLLFATARPLTVTEPPTDEAAEHARVAALKLTLPPVQTGRGPLTLTVANPAPFPVKALLLARVKNFTGSLRHAWSTEITVPARGTLPVTVPDLAPELSGGPVGRRIDTAENFTRVEAGLSAPDRRAVAVTVSGVVDRTPALTLAVTGEDGRLFAPVESWPLAGFGFSGGDTLRVDRYTYFCGEEPKLRVRVANARHNIAPLAVARDADWPENLTAEGLNDLAYSYENLRAQRVAFGFWAGRKRDTQRLQLEWPLPVTAVGQVIQGQGKYRNWFRNNPRNFTLTAGGQTLVSVSDAEYELSRRADNFPPTVLTNGTLTVTKPQPEPANEPLPFGNYPAMQDEQTNCAIGEWEVYGWPGAKLPPVARGTLRVTVSDLSAGTTRVLFEREITLEPLTEQFVEVPVPPREQFGLARVDAEFIPAIDAQPAAAAADPKVKVKDNKPATGWFGRGKKSTAAAAPKNADADAKPAAVRPFTVSDSYALLFVPRDRDHLLNRRSDSIATLGMLCSSGFVATNDFGLGTQSDTGGWGGPDDKTWAWAHDLLEIGPRNVDSARYFYLSPGGMTHYTDPWRAFPSGQYVWDWATDGFLDKFTRWPWKGKTALHASLEDRWNGINIGASFTWDDIIHFDEHLRKSGKPGLQARTREKLAREINTQHDDEFQKFEFNRYADELIKSQERFAAAGYKFTVETHGGFPLAGGEFGEKIARTHQWVGTDVFWDMKDNDLFKTLGYRFGGVAVNPDLRSGAYNQWGWVSNILNNPTWVAPSGDVEPSRRQWYFSYWTGRVNSGGEFQPYTVSGFTSQGGFGAKNGMDDWREFNRVQSTAVWVRPERPAGLGIVASWPLQEKRMTPEAAPKPMCGLFAGSGQTQIDIIVGELYARLLRNGVPLSFVASTHTLKNWRGPQPLIVTEGMDLEPWEITALARLNAAGTPVIAVSGSTAGANPAAEKLFGVKRDGDAWSAAAGAEVVKDHAGQPFAYIRRGAAPTLFCPVPIMALDKFQSEQLARLVLEVSGQPLTLPAGVTSSVFSSNGSLFLAVGTQGDRAENVPVAVKPALLDMALSPSAEKYRVIDLDRAVEIPAEWRDGALRFTLPCGANDGRLLQILPL